MALAYLTLGERRFYTSSGTWPYRRNLNAMKQPPLEVKTNPPNIVALPTVFYLTALDTYVRRWLKAYKTYFVAEGLPLVNPGGSGELDNAILDIAEGLVIGDGVASKTTGENTVVALLVHALAFRQQLTLFESGPFDLLKSEMTRCRS